MHPWVLLGISYLVFAFWYGWSDPLHWPFIIMGQICISTGAVIIEIRKLRKDK